MKYREDKLEDKNEKLHTFIKQEQRFVDLIAELREVANRDYTYDDTFDSLLVNLESILDKYEEKE